MTMDANQIKLVQDTFALVQPIADEIAQMFYARLFELDPELKNLFSGDLQERGKQLLSIIAAARAVA
jgi:hemoglobin-like flavoprotein